MIRALFAASALLAVSPAFAEEVRRQISVTGEGSVSAAPDLAILTFGVRAQADNASAAFSQSTKAMNNVLDALDKAGIEARDRQTSQLRINPIYNRRQNYVDRSEIEGYEALSTLTVRLRDIDSAGSVIDSAVKAGANGLESFRLGFDDPKAMRDRARIEAVKDAMAKAEAMAEAAGAKVGEVITLSTMSNGTPGPVVARSVAMAESADVPRIEAGEQTLQVSVSATFALQ